jgi:predicted Rossmann fold nucleotide-binding protein DprA/Smf involved in DNA uptake
MERNTLLYAFSEITVLAHARFKEGGSWHGAVNALRRRLTHLLVPNDGQLAHRALIALGAHPIPAAESIGASLESIKQMSGLNAPEGLLGPNVPAKPSPPFQSALQ